MEFWELSPGLNSILDAGAMAWLAYLIAALFPAVFAGLVVAMCHDDLTVKALLRHNGERMGLGVSLPRMRRAAFRSKHAGAKSAVTPAV